MSRTAHGSVTLQVEVEELPLKEPFRITGRTFTSMQVVVVIVGSEGYVGRGEASGIYFRADDDVPGILKAIESVRPVVEAGIDRVALQSLLPPCGARNALDCALWDLEAKRAHRAVWQLAQLAQPRPLLTTFTLGADTPDRMTTGALGFPQAKALKLKLTGQAEDADRVRQVRAARQDTWLAVDANQGFTRAGFEQLLPVLIEARVQLVEQPLPLGQEAELENLRSPIPIAADESVLGLEDLPRLVGRFDAINIKLDKCGGLTEGLAMAHAARRLGLAVMVGNTIGSSLATAPAFLVGQLCSVVDLDGPALLATDRSPGVVYTEGKITCSDAVWGGP